MARELGKEARNVVVTQVVPHPQKSGLRVVREFRKDLRALDHKATPTFGALEGYIASRIFLKALNGVKGPFTRESIVDALEGLDSFDIGLGEPLHLGKTNH